MTEDEWLAATDARLMILSLRGPAKPRKFQLIVMECCRALAPVWGNDTTRKMLEAADHLIDDPSKLVEVESLRFETRDATSITAHQEANITFQYLLAWPLTPGMV